MFYRYRAFCALVLVFLALSCISAPLPVVNAQIDNNQPTQPFASVVACIRAGADFGLPTETLPRFAVSCFGTKISEGGYLSGAGSLDADPADSSIHSFGDAQPDGTGDLAGTLSHLPERV